MHHMPLEPEVPAQESTRVVQCSMSQCRRMCLQIKLIKFSGPDGHERQAKNPGEVEPQTGFTVQCSAKSCLSNVRSSGTSTILLGWRATRVGPGWHPKYTRADFGQEAVGGLSNPRANDPQANAQTVHGSGAEFRTTTPGQPTSSAQCVLMECADASDVCKAMIPSMSSSAWKHRGSASRSSTRTRWTTSTRCYKRDAGGTEQSVSVQCQVSDDCVGNLCGSHGTRRDKMTPTSVHLNDHTL